jgi:hypothetical protein
VSQVRILPGAPAFPQFRLCFRGSLRAAGCLVAIQFPRLGGCYRREARVLALVLDRSYVQAENFSKFIEAAQCVSERGLYEAFGFGAVKPL